MNPTPPIPIPDPIENPGFRANLRRFLVVIVVVLLLLLTSFFFLLRRFATAPAPDWHARVAESIPLLGHRNWILVVDSAYPLQTSPGIETIETNASQTEVVRSVLASINASIHVRPLISLDAELPFVPESEAPGADAYRAEIGALLKDYKVDSVLHDKLIADVAETGKNFHILVLKTTLAVPYTSVFIRLDCKYWSADSEARLRAAMSPQRGAQPK